MFLYVNGVVREEVLHLQMMGHRQEGSLLSVENVRLIQVEILICHMVLDGKWTNILKWFMEGISFIFVFERANPLYKKTIFMNLGRIKFNEIHKNKLQNR